jgi:hypothetical protein
MMRRCLERGDQANMVDKRRVGGFGAGSLVMPEGWVFQSRTHAVARDAYVALPNTFPTESTLPKYDRYLTLYRSP